MTKDNKIDIFLMGVKSKDHTKDDVEGMKDIYLKIEQFFAQKDFASIDKMIELFLELNFSPFFYVTMLAGTKSFKEKLKNRERLFQRAIDLYEIKYPKESLKLFYKLK